MNEKEIKRKIREFKKLKKLAQVGTPTRRKLNKQIREFKQDLKNLYGDITPEKRELIERIYKLDPLFRTLKIDLRKFSIEQLQYHLNKKENKKC